jgi:methylglutaconyl-CoA hydratase
MRLITYAVDDDALDATVDAVVTDLLAGGPLALAASKQLLARVPGMPADEAWSWTAELSAHLFASEEGREGMTAFLERRPARWVPPESAR